VYELAPGTRLYQRCIRGWGQCASNIKGSNRAEDRTNVRPCMPVLAMAVDPTGSLLCTSSADRTARVWDVAKGFCTHAFRGHAAMVTCVRFHPAGAYTRPLFSST
jgi:WD40 repeat protein